MVLVHQCLAVYLTINPTPPATTKVRTYRQFLFATQISSGLPEITSDVNTYIVFIVNGGMAYLNFLGVLELVILR